MRSIGAAEKALDWLLARANEPRKRPFGKPLNDQGVILDWIARSRTEIDAARLIVLNAAAKIDESSAKDALMEIAQCKTLVPNMALSVIDKAVQIYGAEGISQDTPLARMWAQVRTVRLADGPDEVHWEQLGKRENRRAMEVRERLQRQIEATDRLFGLYGMEGEKGPVRRIEVPLRAKLA